MTELDELRHPRAAANDIVLGWNDDGAYMARVIETKDGSALVEYLDSGDQARTPLGMLQPAGVSYEEAMKLAAH